MEESISKNGYVILDLAHTKELLKIQKIIEDIFGCIPTQLHQRLLSNDQYVTLVKQAKDQIVKSEQVKELLLSNLSSLSRFLGPDIDMQSDIHLRISRPNKESDFIDWHRDTFYGNLYNEINLWIPVFPLEEGAGLKVVEASHLLPSKNIHDVEDKNEFRSQIKKGSVANDIGFNYAPKVDDVVLNINSNQVKLLAPKVGQAILFFGYLVHRAQNLSSITRVSFDLRIKNMHASTNTKKGYYTALSRGVIAKCVEKMILMNS